MNTALLRFGFVLGVATLAACGDSGKGGSMDMDRTVPTEDLAGNMTGDGGGGGGGDMGLPTGTPENEPVNMYTNDDFDSALTIADGQVYEGTVGDVDTTNDFFDLDFYKFTAQAGEVYRITLQARGDYQAVAQIIDQNDTYFRQSDSGGGGSATREFYVPANGTYALVVTDYRNFQGFINDDPSLFVGGTGHTYAVKLEKVNKGAPTALTVPTMNQAGSIGPNNDVQIFSVNTTANTRYNISVAAAALSPASDVDPIVLFLNATGASPVVVGENDNISSTNHDSKLERNATVAGTHLIVVDFLNAGATKTFQLSVTTGDANAESEPNDDDATATPWVSTISTTATTMTGAINPTTAGARDSDNFAIDAMAGDYFEIVVTPGSGSPMIPLLVFNDPDGNTTFLNTNAALAANGGRLEAYAFVSGRHTLLVEDARNNKQSGPFAGDATHTYSISIRKITRTVTALNDIPVATGAQGKLASTGSTIWYTFNVPAGATQRVTVDLDLSTSAGANGYQLIPYMDLFDATGNVVASAARVFFRDLVLAPGTYTLAVAQLNGGASANNHAFRPRILGTAVTTATVADNTTRPMAFDASNGGSFLVRSNLTGGGELWYNLGTLPIGAGVNVATVTPTGGTSIDTVLALTDATGTVIGAAVDDDITENHTFVIATAGQHFIRVTGYDATEMGMLDVRILPGVCAAPGTDAPFINEVMTQPTSQPNDEFVELVNLTANPIKVGGYTIRDASGTRYRFACNAEIASNTATVINGTLANVDPAQPITSSTPASDRLGFDDTDELVLFTDNNGRILDRVVLGAATANVSFARGTGGTCDATPMAGSQSVQLHTACTGQVGGSSPGQKANRTAFP